VRDEEQRQPFGAGLEKKGPGPRPCEFVSRAKEGAGAAPFLARKFDSGAERGLEPGHDTVTAALRQ
jgi:hypothetical protein